MEKSELTNLYDSYLEALAKWLSCNGEVWGVGPTAVFASAAALFLYNELEATVFIAGDHAHVSLLEKTLVSTMVLGMLALMIHLWVCSMRFFQYYLDTLIRDSPNMLLEMTTAGLLGQSDMVPLGPLTRFLRQQQPQIHITVCWFLSLCYADYVRKHYCQRFNMPYLEQWQSCRSGRRAGCTPPCRRCTVSSAPSTNGCVATRNPPHNRPGPAVKCTLRAAHRSVPRRRTSVKCRGGAAPRARSPAGAAPRARPPLGPEPATLPYPARSRTSCAYGSSVSQAKQLLMLLKNSEPISQQLDAHVAVHRTPASVVLAESLLRRHRSHEDYPWRSMAQLPFD